MKKLRLRLQLLATLSLIVGAINAATAADLIIVANTGALEEMEKRQIRDIFMGNNSTIELEPVSLSPKNEARSVFNTKIVGLNESRIQSYWAQMRFSGRKKPPKEFDNVDSVLAFVAENENTVTYVPSGTDIPLGLTIIYSTE